MPAFFPAVAVALALALTWHGVALALALIWHGVAPALAVTWHGMTWHKLALLIASSEVSSPQPPRFHHFLSQQLTAVLGDQFP